MCDHCITTCMNMAWVQFIINRRLDVSLFLGTPVSVCCCNQKTILPLSCNYGFECLVAHKIVYILKSCIIQLQKYRGRLRSATQAPCRHLKKILRNFPFARFVQLSFGFGRFSLLCTVLKGNTSVLFIYTPS